MADFERDRRATHENGSVPVGNGRAGDGPQGSVPLEERSTLREEVVGREREEFGGIKFGSAFFGWLAATGTAVILTALVAATGAAIGLGVTDNGQASLDEGDATTIGIVGAIALIVVLLISYFCGGYVAGRMARFDGLKQGLAVWIWAVAIAVVVAIVGAIAGSQFNILANLNSFPRIPINEGDVTTGGIITAVLLAVASLVGALLGGVAGMRFHRKVDRAGLGR
jgi:amino acid transporter